MGVSLTLFLEWVRVHPDVNVEFSYINGDIQIAMNHCGCYRFKYVDTNISADVFLDILKEMYKQIYEEMLQK